MVDLEFSDSIQVACDPQRLYELVSDVTRMGEWSPVCRACWWDEGAGPQAGAWFTGRNEAGGRTWESRSQVVVAEPTREFTWEVNGGWVRWGFSLAAADGGTRLTQAWKFLEPGIAGFHELFGADAETEIAQRSEAAKTGIPATLAAIKKTAEQA